MSSTSRHLRVPSRPTGAISGIWPAGYRANNISGVINRLQGLGVRFKTRSYFTNLPDGQRWESAFLTDPDGNLIELIDPAPGTPGQPAVSGLTQVTIGVRDMDKALAFYQNILGYDSVLLDNTGKPPNLDSVSNGNLEQRQVLLGRTLRFKSPFTAPDGGTVRLVQVRGYKGKELFAGRRWGDIGQMECCFEVDDLRSTISDLRSMKTEVFHPPTYMDMGSGSNGSFAYIKDPDGTPIEFVEVKKVLWMNPPVFAALLRIFLPIIVKLGN